ncbi:hypothetical protein RHO23_00805 [Mycobacteroides sp. PCS013]
MQAVVLDWSCWGFRCWPGGQTAPFKLSSQSFESPVTAGISMKSPSDQWSANWINVNSANLGTIGSDLLNIQVAERSFSWSASDLGFLSHAFGDFDGQVAAVELGDRTHDAVQQHTVGCFIDILGG